MEIITLSSAKTNLTKHYKKFPKASVSAQYRGLRNNPRYAAYADYLLIALVIVCAKKAGVVISKSQIQRAVRMSDELRGNRQALACLIQMK